MSQQETTTQNVIADQIPDAATGTEEVVVNEEIVEESAEEQVESAPTEEEAEGEKAPEQSKVVKDLIAQRKKRQAAEQEAAYWRGKAEAAEREKQTPVQTQSATHNPDGSPIEPDARAFEDYDAYEKAKDRYLVELAKYQFKLEMQAETEKQKQEAVKSSFQQKLETAMATDEELAEVVMDRTVPISPVMLRVIQESDNPVELLKWLGANRQEASKMYTMDPVAVTRELVRVEAKFAPKQVVAEQPKKVSKAPAPINTLTPSGVAITDDDDLPIEEYHRRRTKAMIGR